MASTASKRLQKELTGINNDPQQLFKIEVKAEDLSHWETHIQGPEDTVS